MFADLHHLSHHAAWRRQLEMLLESTGEGIYGVDLKGRCIFINRAGADLLGYSPDEVLGRHMHYLIHHSYANNERMRVDDCHIYKAFQEGHGIRVDDEVLWRRDGSSFPAEYASYPIHNGNDVVGAVVTFSDISERKRTEFALKFAHDELEVRVRERTAELQNVNEQLRHAHEGLRRLSAHVNSLREEERKHMAREIHDELGASLTALQLDLNWLKNRVGDQPALSQHIDRMLTVTTTSLGATQRILNDLRPGVLSHLGLWAALEALLQDLQLRSPLRCTFTTSKEIERCRLGYDAETNIYRIVQEVMTNIQRHAKAKSVFIDALRSDSHLILKLRDDGCGMHVPAQPTTFGLMGMHERAIALGGKLDICSQPGAGTTITLLLYNAFV